MRIGELLLSCAALLELHLLKLAGELFAIREAQRSEEVDHGAEHGHAVVWAVDPLLTRPVGSGLAPFLVTSAERQG